MVYWSYLYTKCTAAETCVTHSFKTASSDVSRQCTSGTQRSDKRIDTILQVGAIMTSRTFAKIVSNNLHRSLKNDRSTVTQSSPEDWKLLWMGTFLGVWFLVYAFFEVSLYMTCWVEGPQNHSQRSQELCKIQPFMLAQAIYSSFTIPSIDFSCVLKS